MKFFVTGGSGFIGTNLIETLLEAGHTVLNIDLSPPLSNIQGPQWVQGDINDAPRLTSLVAEFDPDYVVHLAALTALDEPWETLVRTNVGGTVTLLEACQPLSRLRRLIIASTQYVNGPGEPFDRNDQFFPNTEYGRSKAEMEKEVVQERFANLPWVIVRPTNVWGPFHMRNATELLRFLKRGYYFHPGGEAVIRCYSFVGNLVAKMNFLMLTDKAEINHKVVYLSEEPLDSGEFLDRFSLRLRGSKVKRFPNALMVTLAKGGDLIRAVGVKFPFFSERLKRMKTSHGCRGETIWADNKVELLGLDAGIEVTCRWLKKDFPEIYGDLR